MRMGFYFILIVMFCSALFSANVYAENISITELQKARSSAKLYAPNFVVIGHEAIFKVFTKPNYHVKFIVEYSSVNKTILEQEANENGVAVFKINIVDDENMVGKNIGIDAYTSNSQGDDFQKAIIQTKDGKNAISNRIEIADKNTEKGVYFSPLQSLNQVMMRYDYSDHSDYNPVNNQMYYDDTPVYIRNMRDAQDNVREIPANINNSN